MTLSADTSGLENRYAELHTKRVHEAYSLFLDPKELTITLVKKSVKFSAGGHQNQWDGTAKIYLLYGVYRPKQKAVRPTNA